MLGDGLWFVSEEVLHHIADLVIFVAEDPVGYIEADLEGEDGQAVEDDPELVEGFVVFDVVGIPSQFVKRDVHYRTNVAQKHRKGDSFDVPEVRSYEDTH